MPEPPALYGVPTGGAGPALHWQTVPVLDPGNLLLPTLVEKSSTSPRGVGGFTVCHCGAGATTTLADFFDFFFSLVLSALLALSDLPDVGLLVGGPALAGYWVLLSRTQQETLLYICAFLPPSHPSILPFFFFFFCLVVSVPFYPIHSGIQWLPSLVSATLP